MKSPLLPMLGLPLVSCHHHQEACSHSQTVKLVWWSPGCQQGLFKVPDCIIKHKGTTNWPHKCATVSSSSADTQSTWPTEQLNSRRPKQACHIPSCIRYNSNISPLHKHHKGCRYRPKQSIHTEGMPHARHRRTRPDTQICRTEAAYKAPRRVGSRKSQEPDSKTSSIYMSDREYSR